MAYTLKTSGIATQLVMCVAIDSDGTTIKEFVNSTVNSQMAVDAAVTVGSSTWKGVSRGYFQTLGSGDFNFNGITFGTTKPIINDGSGHGMTFFAALAGASATTQGHAILTTSSYLRRYSNHVSVWTSGAADIGTATIPSDGTTKFSMAATHAYNTGAATFWGLESGSLAADASGSNTITRGADSQSVTSIGGQSGTGNFPAKWHIACVFQGTLALTDLQSLHNDWFNTLFDSGVGGNPAPTFSGTIANISATQNVAITSVDVHADFSDTDTLTYSAQGTWPAGIVVNSSTGIISGTPTASGTYTSLTVRATDTASQTVDSNTFTITVAAAAGGATITTTALKNNTGTVLSNQTGATAFVYNTTTGALVVKLTAQTTDANGIMTLTNASLVASTTYRVVIVLASGAEGMASLAAA